MGADVREVHADLRLDEAIVIASHPRSGTHLVIDLLRRQFSRCEPPRARYSRAREPYWNIDELVSDSGQAAGREIARMAAVARPLLKTHRRPDFFSRCQYTGRVVPERAEFAREVMFRASRIYVYRSAVFAMKSLYVMTYPNGEVPFGEFIREMRGPSSRVGWWAMHLSEWLRAERTHLVCYDELVREPNAAVIRLGRFIGEEPIMRLPLLPPPPSSPHVERLKKLLALRRDSTALMSFGRPSAAVVATREDLAFMREEAARIDPNLPGLADVVSVSA